jgi:site-specific DNA-methyltransferase (adenine-specific)
MSTLLDKSVDMVLADIPYGLELTKGAIERVKAPGYMRTQDKGKANDTKPFELDKFLEGVSRVSNGCIYIFCGVVQLPQIYMYFHNHPDFMVRQCAWKKTNPSTMAGEHMWLSTMENCVFAKRRRTTGFKAKCKSAVWDFPTGRGKLHPTEKPLKMFKYLVESSSNPGDVVFDPCLGSGTSAIAAIETGRRYLGCEIDKDYFDIAKNRISTAGLIWEQQHEYEERYKQLNIE